VSVIFVREMRNREVVATVTPTMTPVSRITAVRASVLAALACLLLLAVGPPGARADDAAPPAPASGLDRFDSCADLAAYVRARAPRLARAFGANVATAEDAATSPGAMPVGGGDGDRTAIGGDGSAAAPATPGVDYSETNNQEAGVDEPDVVKTDGRRMFVLDGGSTLRVLDVTGGVPKLIDTVELPTPYAMEMLLSGDRLLVLAEPGDSVRGLRSAPDAPLNLPTGGVQLILLDVADPANVRVLDRYVLSGWLQAARLTGTTVRVVTQAAPNLALRKADLRVASKSRAAARRTWRKALQRSTAANWLPVARRIAGKGATLGPAVGCTAIARPQQYSGVGTLTVSTVDLTAGLAPVDADSIMSDGGIVYASTTGLYVATQRSVELRFDEDTPPPVLDTVVHRFDTATPNATDYRGSGQVRGSLLNQFSMSELGGVLRVATTEAPLWWQGDAPDSESFVTTLTERDGRLDELGRVGGLGKGERIYAVRFLGNLGYVVTFRQVDPLYVVDLADPTTPTVRGELKIRGYSAYLHPVGDGLLLGVGQDASDEGRVEGTQISLFDVSNPDAPTRLSPHRLPGAWSDAEWQHHAFLWWQPAALAVIPVWVPGDEQGRGGFVGALAASATRAAGIREEGRVTHPVTEYVVPPDAPEEVPTSQPTAIVRSLVVGDNLLTVSAKGVKASRLTDLGDAGWAGFPGGEAVGAPMPIDTIGSPVR